MKYLIDCGDNIANLYTPNENWKTSFYKMAMPNPKIRKQIKKATLISVDENDTNTIMKTEYERLECGDYIVVLNKLGVKLRRE